MNKIEYIMLDVGCPAHLKGYDATYHGIRLIIENPGMPVCVIYDRVGDILHCKPGSVERSIRHMVEWMLSEVELSGWKKYFGNSISINCKLPNNQFLHTLARHVKEELNVNDGR